jgi:hypothetical protein
MITSVTEVIEVIGYQLWQGGALAVSNGSTSVTCLEGVCVAPRV